MLFQQILLTYKYVFAYFKAQCAKAGSKAHLHLDFFPHNNMSFQSTLLGFTRRIITRAQNKLNEKDYPVKTLRYLLGRDYFFVKRKQSNDGC